MPNKTLYKDYLEFLKTLPGDSDNDVIDLDPTCSMVKHLDNGLGFLRSLAKTNQSLEDSSPTASDVTDAGLYTIVTIREYMDTVRCADNKPFFY